MVGAANPTAGQSAGTSTGSPAGLMMEEALLRQSRSDLKVQIQQFSVNSVSNFTRFKQQKRGK